MGYRAASSTWPRCGDRVGRASSPRVVSYELQPLSIAVFDGIAGVVHYIYVADVETGQAVSKSVSGRWSEMYLRKNGRWVMVSVSGGPDGER